MLLAGATRRAQPLAGLGLREKLLIALISGIGFTVPVLASESVLAGGAMTEAARLGLALTLLAAPVALIVARLTRRRKTRPADHWGDAGHR
jgi:Na+:H+ antiporter, NhaA family